MERRKAEKTRRQKTSEKTNENQRFWPLGALSGSLLQASWGVLVASWLFLKPSWRVLERSRAVWGGLELVLVASGVRPCGPEPRPGRRPGEGAPWYKGGRGPGPGISHICIYMGGQSPSSRTSSSLQAEDEEDLLLHSFPRRRADTRSRSLPARYRTPYIGSAARRILRTEECAGETARRHQAMARRSPMRGYAPKENARA